MTIDGFVLRGLHPTLGLEALAGLGEDLRELWDNGTSGRVEPSVLQSELLLFVPEAAARQRAFQRLVEIVDERAPGRLQRHQYRLQEGAWPPLESVLPLLLLESGRDGEAARPQEDEWLLIDEHGDPERTAKLSEDLRFHATHTYVAVAGNANGPGSYCFFHVLADPKRKPSLEGLIAGGGLAGLARLAAFRDDGQTVFLPEDRAPSQSALSSFRQVIAARYGARAEEAQRLIAVALRGGQKGAARTYRVYPLFRFDFSSQAVLTPTPSPAAEVEILALAQSPQELGRLRQRIVRAEPLVGHRLELRAGHPAAEIEIEQERVAQELADLEQRWVYLESLRRPRPVLFRFTQRQLPALADAICCFPPSDVNAKKISYAFQATQDQPAGLHYLFFYPAEAVQTEPYPPWRWSFLRELDDDSGSENMRFWLDPFWAHDYHDAGEQCLVFVPHGKVLFPALHSWQPASMDAYLRELLQTWFRDAPGIAEVPRRAIYLFDEVRRGEAGAESREIRIQVLDREGFTPMTEQIGWINDNLTLQHALGGIDAFIARLADQSTRRALAEEFQRRAEDAEIAFAEAADKANRKVAAGASELLEVMTEEIAKIAEKCGAARGEIVRRHGELKEAETALAALTKAGDEVRESLETLEKAAGENARFIKVLNNELTRLEGLRHRTEAEVREAIRKLEETYDELLDRLWRR